MCGGSGSRLDAPVEKPLYEIDGRPMIMHVLDALESSQVCSVYAVVSPDVPRTREELSLPTIDAPGDGYVDDLGYALEHVEMPVMTATADLPLLTGEVLDSVLDWYTTGSLAVCVPVALKRRLGVSVDTTVDGNRQQLAPAGVNVVSQSDGTATHVAENVRLAVNVNYRTDAQIAEALL